MTRISSITANCAICDKEFQKAPSAKVYTCGAVCSLQFKRKRRREYTRKLWKEIQEHRRPKPVKVVTCASFPDPNLYIERDTPKRRAEKAKRAAIKMEINALRLYDGVTYLTDDERRKHQQKVEKKIGKPRVWHGVKERRLAR